MPMEILFSSLFEVSCPDAFEADFVVILNSSCFISSFSDSIEEAICPNAHLSAYETFQGGFCSSFK